MTQNVILTLCVMGGNVDSKVVETMATVGETDVLMGLMLECLCDVLLGSALFEDVTWRQGVCSDAVCRG